VKHYRARLKHNTYIPLNFLGPGLSIAYLGSIVVNDNARVNENCRIQEDTTIGANTAHYLSKTVFLGSGTRVIGDIRGADNVGIGINATVVKNIDASELHGGVSAKQISNHTLINNLCTDLFK
jgi:serine O-acetyltransferase